MRMLGAIAITLVAASVASAEVFVTVYRCDGKTPLAPKDPNTPHVYTDIMVGTRLVLIVSSDKPWPQNYWWGSLLCSEDDWERGKLLGRGYDPNSLNKNYRGSYLPAAGLERPGGHSPLVTFHRYTWLNSIGFELRTVYGATTGDWFILDYDAEDIGLCNVGLFDYDLSFDVPKETHTFNHVPSRDFDGNGIVNFADFASMASHWRQSADPNSAVRRPWDINASQLVNLSDLAIFADYWLVRTDCAAASEPNAPAGGL